MPAPSCYLSCDCLGSLAPDEQALSRAQLAPFGPTVSELCGADLDQLSAALEEVTGSGAPLVIGCRRKEGFFRDLLANSGIDIAPGFVDVHAHALWSDQAAQAGPKLAALAAKAAVDLPAITTVTYDSKGVTLILGAGDEALELARQLQDRMDVTVLLRPGAEVLPRLGDHFAVAQGQVREAKGWLGDFTLLIDRYALSVPGPRADYGFDAGRDGAVSRCDLVIDLTGNSPLFSADDLRPGYLRSDPRRPGALSELALKASDLTGSFDKERFVELAPDLCAHSRNQISGCSNCLDLCPTGAILSGGDSVTIDPMICAGCGQCAAACPSGAISYQVPPVGTLAQQVRAMIAAYAKAGATNRPVILFCDLDHGAKLIEMSARLGRGLPAHVIPQEVNEITRVGPDILAAAMAWGADVAVLVSESPRHELTGLTATLDLMQSLIAPMGLESALRLISCDDPDQLESVLREQEPQPVRSASHFIPPEDKRGLLIAALTELNRIAPKAQEQIALNKGAPFGTVILDTDACTLCMACAGACPAKALIDNPETPMLRFTESACLQCGICAQTCPEQAISLVPQLDFTMWDQPRRILHEEEPFCCTDCGTGFGTRSGIERVIEKLSSHWMFTGARGETGRAMLTLCEDCRVKRSAEAGFEPHH